MNVWIIAGTDYTSPYRIGKLLPCDLSSAAEFLTRRYPCIYGAGFTTIALQRFNQTSGIHTVQRMYGCELQEDGTTKGFFQDAYDGQDFISFDKETQTWTAPVQQAVITKQKWDAERAMNQQWKGYLEGICIEWLKKYLRYGKETLERKVRPQVKLSDRPGSEKNSIVLTCMVTGFHPRAIDVTWIRDGETRMDNAHTDGILPNEDGTYQIKKTIEIGSDDKRSYACEVDHGSLNPKLNVVWAPPSGSNMVIIIAVVIVVLVLVAAAIVGFVMWKKKNGGYSQAQTKESSSDTSSDTTPPKV
nr:PREDICTED: class I histocompatibility antigen, F10 alpha chain-like [Latimeria chalumnae]|eukprot:XP_014346882.1 PREDICTED: class I histocompatibility antigen, F10 alpha chain-like [Latimeria chalumnae]